MRMATTITKTIKLWLVDTLSLNGAEKELEQQISGRIQFIWSRWEGNFFND
jgi:hypothetical protein